MTDTYKTQKPGVITSIEYLGEGLTGTALQS